MRKAISQAVAKETSRGWRITKSTSAHKIDLVAALSFACYGCIQGQSEPQFSALDMALANHGEDYFKRGS
jgi:phage terminase large subunit-like protein